MKCSTGRAQADKCVRPCVRHLWLEQMERRQRVGEGHGADYVPLTQGYICSIKSLQPLQFFFCFFLSSQNSSHEAHCLCRELDIMRQTTIRTFCTLNYTVQSNGGVSDVQSDAACLLRLLSISICVMNSLCGKGQGQGQLELVKMFVTLITHFNSSKNMHNSSFKRIWQ